MTDREYKKLTLKEMQKRRWRLTVDTASRIIKIAAGTEVRIVGKRGDLEIETPKCQHCGVTAYIRGVSHCQLEEIT